MHHMTWQQDAAAMLRQVQHKTGKDAILPGDVQQSYWGIIIMDNNML